jgi:hypothetical protein
MAASIDAACSEQSLLQQQQLARMPVDGRLPRRWHSEFPAMFPVNREFVGE